MGTIKNFTDLNAWQEGHKLVILIYKLTKMFPNDEKYALSDQIKRATVSITSNIAEGFSRQSPKEKIQFYYIAVGSITEVQNQLYIARDVKYLNEKEVDLAINQSYVVQKLVHGLIKSSKSFSYSKY